MRIILGALVAAITIAFATPVSADGAYPSRRINVIAPTNPGSGADAVARFFCAQLGDALKQPCTVDNKPGANSIIGVNQVKQAPSDGYTVLLGGNSPMAVNPSLVKNLPYDPVADFKPIYGLMKHTNVVIVPASSPVTTVEQLVALGKQRDLDAGVSASLYELATHWFTQVTQTKVVQVPYKGIAPLGVDMLSGRLDFAITDLAGVVPILSTNKVRAIAVLSDTRHRDFPNVPTVKESGYPEIVNYSWTAFFVRSDVPDSIAARLVDAMGKIMERPDAAEFARKTNLELLPLQPTALRKFQADEIERFRRITAKAHIEPK